MSRKYIQGFVLWAKDLECNTIYNSREADIVKDSAGITFTKCPATLIYEEPTNDSEFCHCICHIHPLLHSSACCDGICFKCDRHILKNREEHMAKCQDYLNPDKLYEKLREIEKENCKLKEANTHLRTIYGELNEMIRGKK